MDRKEMSKATPPIFIGKWTTEILFSLQEKPHRHGQLQLRPGSVSQRMLTRTLRNLESTSLITRSMAGPDTRAVEYSLNELGRTFMAPLNSMCQWARQHRKDLSAELCVVESRETH